MDFDLSATQRSVTDALDTLLIRYAGPQRCRKLDGVEGYDHALDAELRTGGFFDLFDEPSVGPAGAALAVERIGAHLGTISAAAHLLVLPALGLEAVDGAVALMRTADASPIRFGGEAAAVLVAGDDHAVLHPALPSGAAPSAYGFALGRIDADAAAAGGVAQAAGSAATMTDWWRVGLAAEAVGMMQSAVDIAVRYAKDRTAFRRPIGSFQALAHRLAELSVLVTGARWLTYEAAFLGAPTEAAAAAAAHAAGAIGRVTRETHQLMGAIGLTREHDLHLYTLRLQSLRTELDGVAGHRRALTAARWGGDRR
ncbi:acyl-CoA dehydrogenase family protein [Gordonia neofelifaecis]|uniref:Acyl-CoA dehydrogenase n=1 Tax=Gordonia neofelifaecis NRRL B-59395 TaxID=644548 RepID=F1YK34_9ACTN|nr:acyl-CoA dehydrogenase family protein [Gordonia neofelifaecis]EGD54880.1 acyl-CoA dehydrogenase [Gordonia neofelifaecis NRRL B-59395]